MQRAYELRVGEFSRYNKTGRMAVKDAGYDIVWVVQMN
jgi:hypothetical protein